MTFEELHEILDNENRKLSIAELKQVIYELKQDCFAEVEQHDTDISKYEYYYGQGNAFQIVLDLLEHLLDNSESELEKRVKSLEEHNEQQRQKQIGELEAEITRLKILLSNPIRLDWFHSN